MKILNLETFNFSIKVEGLEFDATAFGNATLSGFESITINDTITLTFEEWREFYSSKYAEIEDVLNQAVQKEFLDWRETRANLREFLAKR